MQEKIIEFLNLIQEKGIEEDVILSENINTGEEFIEFIEDNLTTEDIKDIALFLFNNSIRIEEVFEYVNDKFQKNSKEITEFPDFNDNENENYETIEEKEEKNIDNKVKNNKTIEAVFKKLDEISEKIDKLANEKGKSRFSELNDEIKETEKFVIDLRKSVNEEVKIYSQSLLTSVEENFKNLSNIITNLAEKFVTLKTVLNNEYDLSKISSKNKTTSEKGSMSKYIFIILLSIIIFLMVVLWKVLIK